MKGTVIAYAASACYYNPSYGQCGYAVILKHGDTRCELVGGRRRGTAAEMLAFGVLDTLLTLPVHVPVTFILNEGPKPGLTWEQVMSRGERPEIEDSVWYLVRRLIAKRSATTEVRTPNYLRGEESYADLAYRKAWLELFKHGPRPRVMSPRKRRAAMFIAGGV
ncbi:hypothetical protein [Aestuariivirga litoralis]|uniref:hypothetical protein n=1 Tax=Aestuariivirga litoralis TaxID=2650924 RepID=UPI0018C4845E|nr:hypothetical protein [Aestuariivirga litoralis]MBG1230894.1 hypothetical protein [Aestuariivirga litoralis]